MRGRAFPGRAPATTTQENTLSTKDTRQLIRRLRRQGFRVRFGGSGHYRVTGPDGQTITMPSTPSSYRGLRNALAWLRRIGARP